jgi:hypothetical protein
VKIKYFLINILCFGSALYALVVQSAPPASAKKDLEHRLQGVWKLTKASCAGEVQDISKMAYTLSFSGRRGEYVSKAKACTQVEPEDYAYVGEDIVVIKQGVRRCSPKACAADLPETECGRETNPKLPQYKVGLSADGKGLTLTTDDPVSIDCTGPKQKKPAVFVFEKNS